MDSTEKQEHERHEIVEQVLDHYLDHVEYEEIDTQVLAENILIALDRIER